MVELQGKSGVRHSFARVDASPPEGVSESGELMVESVADVLESIATVTDVVALYAKAYDVRAREVSLEAPSFDKEAEKLAAGYGIRLSTK